MNIVRKIIIQSIFKKGNRTFMTRKLKPSKARKLFSPSCKRTCFQIAFSSTLIPQGKINVEDDLRQAVEEGETAILDLMDLLQNLVLTASKEYRHCLLQQIELLKKASIAGQEAWDELPKFRTVASELSNELNTYLVLLKTIGDMAYEQTLLSLMIDKNSLQKVLNKYHDLELIVQKEFEQNKMMEKELLKVNIDNILAGS